MSDRTHVGNTWGLTAAVALAVVCASVLSGCSVRRMAVNSVGNALAEGGATWSSDDDPELIRDAMPFALKTTESLLAESPRHKGLLLSAVSGFTQYAYAFVQNEADYIEDSDLATAIAMRRRARRLYRRAQAYGIRGLEVDHPGLGAALVADPVGALAPVTRDEVPLLYWTAAAWGSEISLAKDDPDLAVELPLAAALIDRARELDPSWGLGAIWDFTISYESRPAAAGGSVDRALAAFDEAMRLADGRRVSPLVSLAENVAVATQDRAMFTSLLERALAVDADTTGDQRLANLIAQKRARWLLEHADDLFIE